jgi:hypothetical protein
MTDRELAELLTLVVQAGVVGGVGADLIRRVWVADAERPSFDVLLTDGRIARVSVESIG